MNPAELRGGENMKLRYAGRLSARLGCLALALALCLPGQAQAASRKRNKKEIVSLLKEGLETMQQGIPPSLRPFYYGSQNYLLIQGRYDPAKNTGVAYRLRYSLPMAPKTVEKKLLSAARDAGFAKGLTHTSLESSMDGRSRIEAQKPSGEYLYIDLGHGGEGGSILQMEAPKVSALQQKHVPPLLQPFAGQLDKNWYISELSSGPGDYDYGYPMNYFCLQMRYKDIVWEDGQDKAYLTIRERTDLFYALLERLGFSDVQQMGSGEDGIDLEAKHSNGDWVQIWLYPSVVKIFYRVGDIPLEEKDFPLVQLKGEKSKGK